MSARKLPDHDADVEALESDMRAIQKALMDNGADDRRATIAAVTFVATIAFLPGQRNVVLATMRKGISMIENGTVESLTEEMPS